MAACVELPNRMYSSANFFCLIVSFSTATTFLTETKKHGHQAMLQSETCPLWCLIVHRHRLTKSHLGWWWLRRAMNPSGIEPAASMHFYDSKVIGIVQSTRKRRYALPNQPNVIMKLKKCLQGRNKSSHLCKKRMSTDIY